MTDPLRPTSAVEPLDPEVLIARMQAAETRLAAHAAAERPGLTRADEATGERWERGQVFAHLAEFPTFWVGQIRAILAARVAGEPEPIPFGRMKTDPGRLGPIEARRDEDPMGLLRDVESGVGAASGLCRSMTGRRLADMRPASDLGVDDRGADRRPLPRRSPRGARRPAR